MTVGWGAHACVHACVHVCVCKTQCCLFQYIRRILLSVNLLSQLWK